MNLHFPQKTNNMNQIYAELYSENIFFDYFIIKTKKTIDKTTLNTYNINKEWEFRERFESESQT